jgi:uncharacterized protein
MIRTLLVAFAVSASLGAQAQRAQGAPVPGPVLGSSASAMARPAAAAPAGGFREIQWEELVPKGWDPMKELKDLSSANLTDADPRAMEMLKKMREVWDNAPSNAALDGKAVRIPGYVVPLEEGPGGLTEFLLVPYFGACIHSPPPPANQIIHVLPHSAAKGFRSMDPVWISGTLLREKTDSYMGAAGYRMQALRVEPYVEKAR